MKKNKVSDNGLLGKAARFLLGERGTAAIEFAMIVPVLIVMTVTLSDVATIATGVAEMQGAIRSTIQYAMNGGGDMSAAQSHGLAVWAHKPADGTLSATQSCICSGGAADCTMPCASGDPPESYVTVVASGTFGGDVISSTKSFTEKVRVR